MTWNRCYNSFLRYCGHTEKSGEKSTVQDNNRRETDVTIHFSGTAVTQKKAEKKAPHKTIGWVGAILNRGKSEQGGANLNKLKFFVA